LKSIDGVYSQKLPFSFFLFFRGSFRSFTVLQELVFNCKPVIKQKFDQKSFQLQTKAYFSSEKPVIFLVSFFFVLVVVDDFVTFSVTPTTQGAHLPIIRNKGAIANSKKGGVLPTSHYQSNDFQIIS